MKSRMGISMMPVFILAVWMGSVLPSGMQAQGAAAFVPVHPVSSVPDRSALTVARLQYGGGDWYTGPTALPNLLDRIARDTGLPVARGEVVLNLLDPALADHPYLYMTGHGAVEFSPAEAEALRRHLEAGGFLHADDNYGMDEAFRLAMRQVFPDRDLVEIPPDHPVFHAVHALPEGLPKVHAHDDAPPQAFGILLDGRLAVFYSFESDLTNGWEDPGVHDVPRALRDDALRMGVNLFVHALSSRTP